MSRLVNWLCAQVERLRIWNTGDNPHRIYALAIEDELQTRRINRWRDRAAAELSGFMESLGVLADDEEQATLEDFLDQESARWDEKGER